MYDYEAPEYDANAEAYRNCYKSMYGFNPSRYPATDAEYAAWFAWYDTEIDAEIARDREMENHYAELDAIYEAEEQARLEMAALFPDQHYIPAKLADGWR